MYKWSFEMCRADTIFSVLVIKKKKSEKSANLSRCHIGRAGISDSSSSRLSVVLPATVEMRNQSLRGIWN